MKTDIIHIDSQTGEILLDASQQELQAIKQT